MNTYMTIRYMDELRERGLRITLEELGGETPLWSLTVKDGAGTVAFSTLTATAAHAFEQAKALFGMRQPTDDELLVNVDRVRFTRGARERIEETYPYMTTDKLKDLTRRALRVDRATLWPLLGRVHVKKDVPPSVYLVTEDRQGVLILEPDGLRENGSLVCITYLRFVESQVQAAKKLWPRSAA